MDQQSTVGTQTIGSNFGLCKQIVNFILCLTGMTICKDRGASQVQVMKYKTFSVLISG